MADELEEKLIKKATKKNIHPGQPVVAQKTYFYERSDGSIFDCRAREAEAAHKKFKQVGVSDGTRAAQIIADLQKNYKKFPWKKIQEEMRRAWSEELEIARGHFENPPSFNLNTLADSQLQQTLGRKYGQ